MSHTHMLQKKRSKYRFSIFVKLIKSEIFTSKHLKQKLTTEVDHRSVTVVTANIYLARVLDILLQALHMLTHFKLPTPL